MRSGLGNFGGMRSCEWFRRSLPLVSLALLTVRSGLALSQVAPTPIPAAAPSAPVRVTLQVDADSTTHFDADGFELKVSPTGLPAVNAEMQLVKQAGTHTGSLMALSAKRVHAQSVIVEVLDSAGVASMTFRLSDVIVVSDRVVLTTNRANLEQQSISQQETLSALNADYQEALRQLTTAEELGKNHVGTRLELARARDKASDLQRRVDLLKQRQARLARQLGGSGLEETIVLHFGQLEVESRDANGRVTIDGVMRVR